MSKQGQKKFLDSILKFSFIYNSIQNILGAKQARQEVVDSYIRPAHNEELLDFGSGTSELLEFLPKNIKYTGIEPNAKYIETASKKFRNHPTIFFENGSIDIIEKYLSANHLFDKILILAVLHHLSDQDSISVINKLFALLKKDGKLIVLDPIKHVKQNPLARLIFYLDRGANIKNFEEYQKLFERVNDAGSKKFIIRKDLLKIPYSHIISIIKK